MPEMHTNSTERDVSTDDQTDHVQACPECDSTEVYYRQTKAPDYRCTDCGFEGDDMAIRQRKGGHRDGRKPEGGYDGFVATVFHEVARYQCREGSDYVKSHEIASELDASTKQVGQALSTLCDDGLLQKWGRSNSITWHITEDLQAGTWEVPV